MIPIEMNNRVDEFFREVKAGIDKYFLKNLYIFINDKTRKRSIY